MIIYQYINAQNHKIRIKDVANGTTLLGVYQYINAQTHDIRIKDVANGTTLLGVYQYINASPSRYAQTQEDTISDAESVLLD